MTTPQQKAGRASLVSERVSAAQLQQYLKGMSYPADKKAIIARARSNNAPENVMSVLNQLPERSYSRPTEIEQEFGKMSR
ncbi:MAG: DUF2795 domain-containing protein [Chloroflexi bacterium]|nr:DUF2795 domain-containing protein [Chloroflexota bacterium]